MLGRVGGIGRVPKRAGMLAGMTAGRRIMARR
jgi:hypothetical protein